MATRERDFNSAIGDIPESAYVDGDDFIYPTIGREEVDGMEVVYVEYEHQQGGDRATFPENVEHETRIAGILEDGDLRDPSDREYDTIREELLESDRNFHRPIGRGLLDSHYNAE